MNHVHGNLGEGTEMVVLALDRYRCEGRRRPKSGHTDYPISTPMQSRQGLLTFSTAHTVPGLAHFSRDGDTLSARPPRPRRRQALPEARMCCRKVVTHGHESSAVRDGLHGASWCKGR